MTKLLCFSISSLLFSCILANAKENKIDYFDGVAIATQDVIIYNKRSTSGNRLYTIKKDCFIYFKDPIDSNNFKKWLFVTGFYCKTLSIESNTYKNSGVVVDGFALSSGVAQFEEKTVKGSDKADFEIKKCPSVECETIYKKSDSLGDCDLSYIDKINNIKIKGKWRIISTDYCKTKNKFTFTGFFIDEKFLK